MRDTLKLLWWVVVHMWIVIVSVIRPIAIISNASKACLPGHLHWTEEYFAYLEYLRRYSKGVKTTYNEVLYEMYIKPFQDAMKEAEERLKNRPMDWY